MEQSAVLDQFRAADALMEGHFILSSGRHSEIYLQCARVMMDPARGALLCGALAKKIRATIDSDIELVISPAMGGVVVGYEMARQLGIIAIFAERVEGKFSFRRGFDVTPGARVLMVEDIITTGLSSRECIEMIGEAGGNVVAGACLIDRSGGKANIGVPLVALAALEATSYAADDLPAHLIDIAAVKPGSRGLK